MCGITGVVWLDGKGCVTRGDFDRMTDILSHRGPDGRGVYWHTHSDDSGVALGHRRLSIIDIAAGTQPMCNEDASIWIVFNGEIYNYRELRPELKSAGHRFMTHSDTETIIHLYEQYGDAFLQKLRGMFAIAIWDMRRRRLLLARDRLGKKPLVYCQTPERIVFASEIKSLLCAPGIRRDIRLEGIDEYLTYGYVPHPGTIFEGIHKLPPAHFAVYEHGHLSVQRYWNPDLMPDTRVPVSQLREELDSVLDEAVRLRLRSDVPLGAFLSGGIDSTTIVGLMQRHSTRPTNTFTIGFPVDGFDESRYARIAANHLGTNHLEMEVRPNSLDVLARLVWHFDEPFADSSAVPTYYVSQMTREHVKVALTGDGGDELFAGYDRYRTIDRLAALDRLPAPLRSVMTGRWSDWIPRGPQKSFRQRLKHRLHILRQPLERRYISWVTGFTSSQLDALYQPEVRNQLRNSSSASFLEHLLQETTGASPGIRAMRADLQSYLPCDLLAKVDIASMAHGLECRCPFLDHHVVELAAKFPFAALTASGDTKPMLTTTFSQLIPPELRRRPKMGFSVPLDRWFRNDLEQFARDTLLASDAFCHTYFRPSGIDRLLQEHQSGEWGHGDRIWSLLFFELWGQTIAKHPAATYDYS